MRVAAAGPGLLLVVDDLHDADEASLRLLHYLARCAVDERVVLVLAHREPAPALVHDITASMVARGGGHLVELKPLGAAASQRLLLDRFPGLDRESVEEVTPDRRRSALCHDRDGAVAGQRVHHRVGGPAAGRTTDVPAGGAPGPVLRHRRATGRGGCVRGRDLRPARARRGCPRGRTGRGRLPLPAPPRQGGTGAAAGPAPAVQGAPDASRRRWPPWTGPRGGSPTTTWPPASPSRAVPYVVQAVEIAGALGAYRDALALVDGVREHAGPEHRPDPAGAPRGPADGAGRLRRRRGVRRGGAGHDRHPASAGARAAGAGRGRRRRPRDRALGADRAGAGGRRGGCLPAPGPRHGGLLRRRHGDGAEGRDGGS